MSRSAPGHLRIRPTGFAPWLYVRSETSAASIAGFCQTGGGRSGLAVVAAEVRLRAFLASGDDAPADLAGPREQLEQLVALAPADSAGERLQVLGEPAQNL